MMDKVKTLFDVLQEGFADIAGISHCSAFPKRRDDIRLPAVLIDLVEIEPGRDPGTGELALTTHWEARILFSDQEPQWHGWALVQQAMSWLDNHHWSELNIGRANIKQATPDHFSPELQGHSIWLLEWTHAVRVGDNLWNGEDAIPSIINVGWGDGSYSDLGAADEPSI